MGVILKKARLEFISKCELKGDSNQSLTLWFFYYVSYSKASHNSTV